MAVHRSERAPRSRSKEQQALAYMREGQHIFEQRYGNSIRLGVAGIAQLNAYLRKWHEAFRHGEPEIDLPFLIDNFVQTYHNDVQIPETPATNEDVHELVTEYGALFAAEQVEKRLGGDIRMMNHMVLQKVQLLHGYTSGAKDKDPYVKAMLKSPVTTERIERAIAWIVDYNKWSKRDLQNILYSARREKRTASREARVATQKGKA